MTRRQRRQKLAGLGQRFTAPMEPNCLGEAVVTGGYDEISVHECVTDFESLAGRRRNVKCVVGDSSLRELLSTDLPGCQERTQSCLQAVGIVDLKYYFPRRVGNATVHFKCDLSSEAAKQVLPQTEFPCRFHRGERCEGIGIRSRGEILK